MLQAAATLGQAVHEQLVSPTHAPTPSSTPSASASLTFTGWHHATCQFKSVARCDLSGWQPPPPSRYSSMASGEASRGRGESGGQSQGGEQSRSSLPHSSAASREARRRERRWHGDERPLPLSLPCPGRLLECTLLDSLPAKLGAIAAGVDAACTLLQVDGVLIEA